MSQANHYMGQWMALLTRQGTEPVIAPILAPALACRIERGSGFDTDRLGSGSALRTVARNPPRARSLSGPICVPSHDRSALRAVLCAGHPA